MSDNAQGSSAPGEQDCMQLPKPTEQHQWLDQLVGEWSYTGTADMGPDQPQQEMSGTESVRSLGGIFIQAELQGKMPDGSDATAITVIGYDPDKGCYVGCWYGMMMMKIWHYEGQLSADGSRLPLGCEGPVMDGSGATTRYEDEIEIVNADHRRLRSRMLTADGNWMEFMRMEFTRTK